MPYRQLAYMPDRRSTRIDHCVSFSVRGVDAGGVPYAECVSTVAVSLHGCSYESKNAVRLGDVVTLEVAGYADRRLTIAAPARVRGFKRLATRQTLFEIAVELDFPENIWGIASPPEDWVSAEPTESLMPASAARGLRVVPSPEPPAPPEPALSAPVSQPEKRGVPAVLPPLIAQLMARWNEQIEVAVRDALRASLAREKSPLLNEIRAQLHDEIRTAVARAFCAPEESTDRAVCAADASAVRVVCAPDASAGRAAARDN